MCSYVLNRDTSWWASFRFGNCLIWFVFTVSLSSLSLFAQRESWCYSSTSLKIHVEWRALLHVPWGQRRYGQSHRLSRSQQVALKLLDTSVSMLNMGCQETFAPPVFTIAPSRIKYEEQFSDVTSCVLVDIFKYVRGTLCFQIRCRSSRFLRNSCNFFQTVRRHITGNSDLLTVTINLNTTHTLTDASSY